MAFYEPYIGSMVTRLAELAAMGYEVVRMPDAEADLSRPSAFKPRITVAYIRSRFTDAPETAASRGMAMGAVVHREFMDLEVVIEAQKLYGDRGYLEAQEKIMRLLTGHRYPGVVKLHLRETQFRQHYDGIFQFCISLSAERLYVEAATEFDVPLNLAGQPATPDPVNITQIDFTE